MGNANHQNPRPPPWLKNTAEKMTSLQICRIKKMTPRTGQTFRDHQLCFSQGGRSRILMISISHTILVLLSCPLYIAGVAIKKIQMSF